MEPYDFGGNYAETYSETCECGRVIEVSSRRDNGADYYTYVYVRCACGKSVEFTLPAN